MGRAEIPISLRTKDYDEAKRRRAALVDEWNATFDDMNRRRDLTDDDIAVAVWEHYSVGVEAGDKERASRPDKAALSKAAQVALKEAHDLKPDDGDAAIINAWTDYEILKGKAEWASRRRKARLARLRADLGAGDTKLIEPDADAFLDRQGFKIDRRGSRYSELCLKLKGPNPSAS